MGWTAARTGCCHSPQQRAYLTWVSAMRYPLLLTCLLAWAGKLSAQVPTDSIAAWSDRVLPEALDTLRSYVALPNESRRLDWAADNAAWIERTFAGLGFQTERIATPTAPFVWAERIVDPTLPTVLFYLQVDGQPADPAAWNQADPYQL